MSDNYWWFIEIIWTHVLSDYMFSIWPDDTHTHERTRTCIRWWKWLIHSNGHLRLLLLERSSNVLSRSGQCTSWMWIWNVSNDYKKKKATDNRWKKVTRRISFVHRTQLIERHNYITHLPTRARWQLDN